MANGDWIKMRTWIARDPKVIGIAAFLEAQPEFVAWMGGTVTNRHVALCVTVTSLLQVWGVTRCDARVTGDDFVIDAATPKTIDSIAGVPCFGDAMRHVGWAVFDADKQTLTLPKFLRLNTSNDDNKKKSAAERQRRYREKHRNARDAERDVVSDVTVTPREEKRREENINTPPCAAHTAPNGSDDGVKPKTKTPPKPPPEPPVMFQKFWEVFPSRRKKSKDEAIRAWLKAVKRVSAERIIAAAIEYAASDEGRGEYAKMPSTWLNQGCWDDDRAAWRDHSAAPPMKRGIDHLLLKNQPQRSQ